MINNSADDYACQCLGLTSPRYNPVSVSQLCESETCGKASIQER
jgi:hypothetical protein